MVMIKQLLKKNLKKEEFWSTVGANEGVRSCREEAGHITFTIRKQRADRK